MADEQQQRFEGIRSVAVIGAGISGILATKYLLQAGLDVTVFERNKKPGGVWLVCCIYCQIIWLRWRGNPSGCTTRRKLLSHLIAPQSPSRRLRLCVRGTRRRISKTGLFQQKMHSDMPLREHAMRVLRITSRWLRSNWKTSHGYGKFQWRHQNVLIMHVNGLHTETFYNMFRTPRLMWD